MKLKLKDKVMVISGKDRGKAGEIIAVLPKKNQIVVNGIGLVKKHLKPNSKNPKGGIIEISKPIDVSKVMIIDPSNGKPARIGYKLSKTGQKERIFKTSTFKNKRVKKDNK
ncbi:MAG: 50S ribosomal protein L24 [bacterium]|nr:50S ribosomal protein L24 [bacterium]